MELIDWLANPTWKSEIVLSFIAVFVLYFGFRKTAELSRHAAENTIATLLVGGANIFVAIFFLNDLNALAQSAYKSLSIPTLDPDIWDNTPLWIVCLIGVAAKDFVDYWNHRLMHTKWGWPTHAAHHSDTHVNAFTANRIHFLEAFLMTCSYIVLLTWMQMPYAIPVVIIFHTLHSKYVHMDLDFEHGPLKYLIASPVYHRWHHADVPEAYGKNLANVMPIYDVIFGTYYNPGKCDAPMGALKSGIADKNPVLILIYPFQEWGRLIRQAWSDHVVSKETQQLDSAAADDPSGAPQRAERRTSV